MGVLNEVDIIDTLYYYIDASTTVIQKIRRLSDGSVQLRLDEIGLRFSVAPGAMHADQPLYICMEGMRKYGPLTRQQCVEIVDDTIDWLDGLEYTPPQWPSLVQPLVT